MSKAVSQRLSLSYDPSVTLHMQSANGNIDRSLGLSRNVPFRIDDLTFYLHQEKPLGSRAYHSTIEHSIAAIGYRQKDGSRGR
jgi:hypothetical protein